MTQTVITQADLARFVVTVTGGTTGTTTFQIASGTGEIDFADGTTIGLGEIEYNYMHRNAWGAIISRDMAVA